MNVSEWNRAQQADQLLLEFRDELDAIHLLGQPTGTTSIDWRYCTAVPTMNGDAPVAPLRIALNTKLKFLLPEHDPDVLNTTTATDDSSITVSRAFAHGIRRHLRRVYGGNDSSDSDYECESGVGSDSDVSMSSD